MTTDQRVRRAASKGAQIVQQFRLLDNGMPSQWMAVFLAVARSEDGELEVRSIPDRLDMSQSAASRAVLALGDESWQKGKVGLQLLTQRTHSEDRRQKVAVLSPKGRALVESLSEIFQEN